MTTARACKLIACMIAIFPSPSLVHKIHLILRHESIPLRYTHRCRKRKNNDHVWSRLWNNFRSLFSETFLSAVRIPRRPPPRLHYTQCARIYIYYINTWGLLYYTIILWHKVKSNNFHYFGIIWYLHFLRAYDNNERWTIFWLLKTVRVIWLICIVKFITIRSHLSIKLQRFEVKKLVSKQQSINPSTEVSKKRI